MAPFEPYPTQTGDQNEPLNLEELGSPTPGESLTENFNPYDYVLTEGPDGMPIEAGTPWQSQDAASIPLTPETVKCLPQPKRDDLPDGLPVCRFYKRQRVHNPQAPDVPMIQRFCTVGALRGINGACMALDDAGIFNCEFRDPIDPKDTHVLNRIDQGKIEKGRIRLREEAATGVVHGYRMFPTPEDIAAGRRVLDEGDVSTGELSRPKLDPFAADEAPPPASAAEPKSEAPDASPTSPAPSTEPYKEPSNA